MNIQDLVAPLAQRYSAKYGRQATVIRAPRYDGIYYPTLGIAASVRFFAVPLGTTDPNDPRAVTGPKKKEDTNIDRPNQLSDDFVATSMRMYATFDPKLRQAAGISGDADAVVTHYADIMEELQDILGNGVLTLKINQKQVLQIDLPFLRCPPGFGPVIDQHGVAATQAPALWVTSAYDRKRYWFTPLLEIPKESTFDLILEYPNATSPVLTNAYNSAVTPYLKLKMVLDGFKIQPAI